MGWIGRGINLPLVLAALALAVYALGFANAYHLRLLTVAGIYAILVIGYQFIFGHAGALSLAQGAFFGVGAYVAGILGATQGWPFLVTFPLAILVPALLAAIIAAPVLRLESHYFALATLGIGQVILLIAINWQSVTGGANGIPGVPGIEILGLNMGRGLPTLLFVWAWVGICALLAWQIMRGLNGRMFELSRSDDLAAMSVGIDIARLRFVAFLLSAVLGGIAGALYVHTIGVISPEALEFPVMVTCLTIAVVGGRYRVAGAVIGAVLLIHIPEWFRFLDKYYLIAYGAVALLMIIAAPYGLIGALERLRQQWLPEDPPAPPVEAPLPFDWANARRANEPEAPLLEIDGLDKRFGGVHAIDDVSLTVARGDILGVIGPNGSGKTTLVNLVTGINTADRGRILFDGRDIAIAPPHEIALGGIGRTFQSAHLVPTMSALDNVAVARFSLRGEGLRAALSSTGRKSALAVARTEAMSLLGRMGITEIAMQPCGALPFGIQRRIEIARALAIQPTLLLLDEPAAGLNEAEQADLARRLRDLSSAGLTLIVVEHNMPFLLPLADRVLCLDAGRAIAAGTADEIRADPQVIAAYLGTKEEREGGVEAVSAAARPPHDGGGSTAAAPLLNIRDLDVAYGSITALREISLSVNHGEAVALLGANGAGKSTLLSSIAGLTAPRNGTISYADVPLIGIPAESRARAGIGYSPEGRRVFAGLTVRENLEAACWEDAAERLRRIDRIFMLFPALGEKADALGWQLSGGQQQMLSIGRALVGNPDLLLLDEPSLGLSPILIAEMFDTVRRITADGTAVLLAEQNTSQALEVCDRAYVLRLGHVVAEDVASDLRNSAILRDAFLGGG